MVNVKFFSVIVEETTMMEPPAEIAIQNRVTSMYHFSGLYLKLFVPMLTSQGLVQLSI